MRIVLLLFLAMSVGACSTHQAKLDIDAPSQYCHTEQKIIKETDANGDAVSSKTVLTCSDKKDPMDNYMVKSGVATQCGYYTDEIRLGGKHGWYKQMACYVGEGSTGRWVIIQNPAN